MTGSERRFLELELKMLLRKLRRNQEKVSVEVLKSVYQKSYEALLREISQKAICYIKEIIFSGMGGYYLRAETAELFEKLNHIVNCPESRKRFQDALFIEQDMVQIQALAAGLRAQVEPVVKEYQKHAEKGE